MPTMLIFRPPYPGPPDADGRAMAQPDSIVVETLDAVHQSLQSAAWPQFNMLVRKDLPNGATTAVIVNSALVRMIREKP
jgi:hypothetical protein